MNRKVFILICIICIIISIILYSVYKIPDPPHNGLYVVGIGGAGNTSMLEYLSKKTKTNHPYDKDSIKHLSKPEDMKFKPNKVLYIYGEPTRSIYSHYRRWDNPNDHFNKLTSGTENNYVHSDSYKIYVNDVLKTKKDLSGLLEHFRRWREYKDTPIFFLDFTKFNEQKNDLEKFLGIKLPDFFDSKRYYSHDEDMNELENKEYKDFYNKIYEKMSI